MELEIRQFCSCIHAYACVVSILIAINSVLVKTMPKTLE